MKLDIARRSDVGCVRGQNEDALHVNARKQMFIIADGMGGHNAGEVASAVACKVISESLNGRQVRYEDTPAALEQAVRTAHEEIHRQARDNPDYEGMGTTVEVLWLRNQTAYWAHVGDSRIYLYRDTRLDQLTEDHSLVNDYLKRGMMSEEQARSTPLRNVILQALGTADELEVETGSFDCKAGDLLLLCSDGLTDVVLDDDIQQILAGSPSLETAADNAVEHAKQAGGPDNISLILIRLS